MAFSIDGWNINPNRLWFVRLSDAGAGILAELFLTEADAQAGTNRQAHGVTIGHGSGLELTLEAESGAEISVSFFQSGHPWHVLVSGGVADPVVIFRVAEFVELDEISHPIYRNEDIIATRAKAEVDAHTHAVIEKNVALGAHLPTLEPGDVVRLDSDRRGTDQLLQVTEHRIAVSISQGGETSLTSTIAAATYLQLRR